MPKYNIGLVKNSHGFLGKSYVYASPSIDGVWRDQHDEHSGKWRSPDELSLKKPRIGKHFGYAMMPEETDLCEFRQKRCSDPEAQDWAFILGQPTTKLLDQCYLHDDGQAVISNKQMPRNQASGLLADTPSHRFLIDADNLDLSPLKFDPDDDVEAVADYISDAFDMCGLDWLLCDHVFSPSSSFGMGNRKIVKAHLDFTTEEPYTLDQQKQIINYVNIKLYEKGFLPNSIDDKIYQPYRLVYFVTPRAFKRVKNGGEIETVSHSLPHRPHIHKVRRGQKLLNNIPGEAWSAPRTVFDVPRAPGLPAPSVGSMEMAPGNVYPVVRARIYKVAASTPTEKQDEARERLRAELSAEICALPDHTTNGVRRLALVAPSEFKRSWDGAVAYANAKSGIVFGDSDLPDTVAVDVDAGRAALSAFVSREVRRGLEYAEAASDPDVIGVAPPRHTLIIAPPGFGKSSAFIGAFGEADLMTYRAGVFCPSTKLSDEIFQRAQEGLKDEETKSRVRQLRGFDQVCYNERALKRKDDVIGMGLSLAGTLCRACPHSNDCAYPSMHKDKSSGFVVAQHAHLPTTVAKIKDAESDGAYDINIIDESFYTTFTRERFSVGMARSRLSKDTSRLTVLLPDGSLNISRTNDTRAYRYEVLEALRGASEYGFVHSREVLSLFAKVKVKTDDRVQVVERLRDAIACERYLIKQLRERGTELVQQEIEEGKDNAKEIKQNLERQAVCNVFLDLYNCINGNRVAGRKGNLFGIRALNNVVRVAYRRPLPDAVLQRYMLCTDGTANPEVVRRLLGDAVQFETHKIEALPTHYKLYQYLDRPFGKTSLVKGNPEDTRSNIGTLANFIRAQSQKHKKVLVIVQKEVLKIFEEVGFNSNVTLLNFGNLRGRDEFKHHDCAIIIGRPMPNSKEAEFMAEALYYDSEDVADIQRSDTFHTEQIKLPLRNRGNVYVTAESHPDPRVRAVLDQVVTAEVQQAVARLRLFNRTADNPAELHVFGQCDTGLHIDEVRRFVDAHVAPSDDLSIHTRSKILLPVLAERVGMSVDALRGRMERADCDWRTFKFRVNHKLTKAKIKATSVEEAAQVLRSLGIEFSELC